MTWQPIATAPKDGTRFLAWTITRGWYAPAPTYQIEFARWTGRESYDRAGCFLSDSGATPTHWMPLPLPPEAPQQEPP